MRLFVDVQAEWWEKFTETPTKAQRKLFCEAMEAAAKHGEAKRAAELAGFRVTLAEVSVLVDQMRDDLKAAKSTIATLTKQLRERV